VRFKNRALTAAMFFLCLVAVPHPFCYYLDTKKDVGSNWEFTFKKNDFFLDCDKISYLPFRTDKDVVVIVDGNEYARIKVDEECPDQR
jgi:hypothetical protein